MPDAHVVEVKEREPFAIWQRGAAYYVIDKAGAAMSGLEASQMVRLPLVTGEGYPIGTLCVIDQKARTLADAQRASLERLARLVMVQVAARDVARQLVREGARLSVVSGTLNITERGISARDLSAQFLGGAATVSLASQPDGSVGFDAQGNASVALVRKFFDIPLLQYISL